MAKMHTKSPIIIDLEDEASSSAEQAPVRKIQSVPKMNDNFSGQLNDNQKYVYYSPEKPIYRCEHCPYFVAIKHLMDNHLKYPNYECLQLRTAKEMEQSKASGTTKNVESTPADLNKSPEEYWFCGDCNYSSTLLNQMEDHVQKYHPNSITAPPSRSRPMLTNESREATPTGADSVGGFAAPVPQRHTKNVKRDLSKSFVYAPHEQVGGAEELDQSEIVAPIVRVFHSSPKRPEKSRDEYYYAPNGTRARYLYCDKCSYKTTASHKTLSNHIHAKHTFKFCGYCNHKFLKRTDLNQHVRHHHPPPTTALPKDATKGPIGRNIVKKKFLNKRSNPFPKPMTTTLPQSVPTEEAENREEIATVAPAVFTTTEIPAVVEVRGKSFVYAPHEKAGGVEDLDQSEIVAPIVRIFHSSPKNPEKSRDEWYYAPHGKRKRYQYCDECSYRTSSNFTLAKHINAKHTFKFCGDCNHKFLILNDLKQHIKNQHPSSTTALPKKATKGPMGRNIVKKKVVNKRPNPFSKPMTTTLSQSVPTDEPEYREEIATVAPAVSTTTEIPAVVEGPPSPRPNPSCFNVDFVVSARNDLRDQITELSQKKEMLSELLEVTLDSLRLHPVKLTMMVELEASNEADQNKVALIEEKVRSLEEQLDVLEEELVNLIEIEKSLTSDLKQAELQK